MIFYENDGSYFFEDEQYMSNTDVLTRLKRLAYLEDQIMKQELIPKNLASRCKKCGDNHAELCYECMTT